VSVNGVLAEKKFRRFRVF